MVVDSSLNNKKITIIKTPNQYTRSFSYILQKGIVPSKAVQVFVKLLKIYILIHKAGRTPPVQQPSARFPINMLFP